jgi:ESCRT-II complex subunit VPS36
VARAFVRIHTARCMRLSAPPSLMIACAVLCACGVLCCAVLWCAAACAEGIIRKVKTAQAVSAQTAEEAFKDLDALMRHARDIVALAQSYADKTRSLADGKAPADEAAAAAAGGAAASEGDAAAFSALLHGLGIPSPVTRTSAGAAYHVQLSRQLSDFLRTPQPQPSHSHPKSGAAAGGGAAAAAAAAPQGVLEAAGGMLTLIDVYCVFNRARGTELISPDDLIHAAELFPKLDIPIRLRAFDSGVKVRTVLCCAAALQVNCLID